MHLEHAPMTGVCATCGQQARVKKDGTLWRHRHQAGKELSNCPGSGMPPRPGSMEMPSARAGIPGAVRVPEDADTEEFAAVRDHSAEVTPFSGARAPEPSTGTAPGTNVRIWSQRQLRRMWSAQIRWRIVIISALAALTFVVGGDTLALTGTGPGSQGAGQTALAAAKARQQAGAWVASQVSADAIVGCDPVMCGILLERHVPKHQLLVLYPDRADPHRPDLVVATPAVRSELGARLASSYAPVRLAAFGSGAARVEVRVVAPDGPVAYRAQLAADVRVRKSGGRILLDSRRIDVAAAARPALADGGVDTRLLVTLATLASIYRLHIFGFVAGGHGASAGIPFRTADISWAGHRASLRGLRAILSSQRPPYLPSSIQTVHLQPGGAILKITYPAPSPLGLLGSRS
jgi:hypothetical protein